MYICIKTVGENFFYHAAIEEKDNTSQPNDNTSTMGLTKKGTEEYNDWNETHKDECCLNHEGPSGEMEIDAAFEMSLKKNALGKFRREWLS